jgi:hypothetical protein
MALQNKVVNPASWLASWSEDGTDITVPIASITGLTAAMADGTTGDIRDVLMLLLDELYEYQEAITPAGAKPEKMLITRSDTGGGDAELKTVFKVTFQSTVVETDIPTEDQYDDGL